jgi:hypothetical protein
LAHALGKGLDAFNEVTPGIQGKDVRAADVGAAKKSKGKK